jgi:hypothetical protein
MGLFDGSGDPSGGLMGMYANPQIAGLLGASQGLLSASGPSRIPVSMGQAMGAGLGGMQQNAGNALQMQMQMAKMQAMMNPFGPPSGGQGAPAQPQQPQQPNPAMAQGAPVSGAANVGPMSGLSAGMGGLMQPQPQGTQPQVAAAPAATDPFAAMFGGHTPQEVMIAGARAAALGNPAGTKMMEMAAQYDPELARQMPTDIQKNAAAAYGYGTPEYQKAIQGQVTKEGYIAPVRAAPGGALAMPDGSMRYTLPAPQAGGMWATNPDGSLIRDQSGQPFQIGVGGASSIAGGMAAAQAGGKAQYQLQQVWDPTANGGQGGFVQQSVANVAGAANGDQGAVPVGIRNNNFGNIKGANGQFATYDTPQAGINAADQTLAAYGAKHGINTIAGIANRWAPTGDGNNNPSQKAAAMAAASGVGVNDPINLSDPTTRARILPALFDTETPGWRNAAGGAPSQPPAARGGPMASQPPQGSTALSNEAQAASAKVMADDYQTMQGVRQNAPTVLQAYDHLLDLAKTGGWQGWAANGGLTGKLMSTDAATYASPAAAEYDKTRAFLINAGGAAMGDHNTDSARANLDRMIPEFGKPDQAKIDGINQARNQVTMQALRANVMTPLFQAGDSKSYTGLANQFDTTIKPEMMPSIAPIMQMSGPQQQAAVQAAAKANPALLPAFKTLFNAGALK